MTVRHVNWVFVEAYAPHKATLMLINEVGFAPPRDNISNLLVRLPTKVFMTVRHVNWVFVEAYAPHKATLMLIKTMWLA